LRSSYDAVVIGAGHNGLVAAAYLALAGLRVGVFEQRAVIGGATITEELWKGYRLSRLSYSYGLFDHKIVKDLRLMKFGLKVVVSDPDLFVPFPDNKHIFIWADANKTAEGFRSFSEKDAKNYHRYLGFWKRLNKIMEPVKYDTHLSPNSFVSIFERAHAIDDLRTLLFSSVSDFLDEYFESEQVKAAICPRGLIGTFVGPRTPGTAYVLAYHVMGESAGETGVWGWLKGGMGALSQAVANCALSLGVEIFTGCDVSRILVDGRARGVKLSDGRKVMARYVLANVDPKQTFLNLVGKEHLDDRLVRDIQRIRDEGCVLKLNAAIEELPNYKALPGKGVRPQHKGITGISPSVDYCERAFDDAKYGKPSRRPFLRIGHHSANDPSMAPRGKHVMSIFAQYFPYRLAKGSWEEIRQTAGDSVIDTLAEYAPNIRRAIIHQEVLTPVDLEREFRLPKGNIFHMEITPDQMFFLRPVPGWSNYRTPIDRLYLCGSGSHPGGGVTGLPGYNAARVVVAEARKERQNKNE
jgi:phytoene dehydrogenase-like protein